MPPQGFFIRLLFSSTITLIFIGWFLHSLFRLINVKIDWLRVPTTDFSRQKIRTRSENPNLSKPSCKARKKPPKGHTKNRPFVLCII